MFLIKIKVCFSRGTRAFTASPAGQSTGQVCEGGPQLITALCLCQAGVQVSAFGFAGGLKMFIWEQ